MYICIYLYVYVRAYKIINLKVPERTVSVPYACTPLYVGGVISSHSGSANL